MKATLLIVLSCLGLLCASVGAAAAMPAGRATISLDGTWDVEEGSAPDSLPRHYGHRVPVPGLTHSATPRFVGVDEYQTQQLRQNLVVQGRLSQAEYDKAGEVRGVTTQTRRYFWYRKTFTAPARRLVALLKVSKAQFGIVAYVNGIRIGEHLPCFTAAYFDVTRALRWSARNEVVIRVGAHPGVLPANVTPGSDFEKNRWTPGIYDDVSLMALDNPVIASVQVAPQIATVANPLARILVQTELHNYSGQTIGADLHQQVFERQTGKVASGTESQHLEIPAGATRVATQTIPMPGAHLWSPEDPFLYRVASDTGGDNTTTRFGMREFRFDTTTQRAYLNGRPYFLRGSNVTLHRFFEDPQVGTLPWSEPWLQRLLVDIPKQLHWNAFRFCIGPVPDRWLEIADESGLIIQNQFPVWVGSPLWTEWRSHYDFDELETEYTEWLRDNWNHPSVAVWDASNESWLPELTRVVENVRKLDLSGRAWSNGYNAPSGADDPVEDHQYLLQQAAMLDESEQAHPFKLTDMESMLGPGLQQATYKSGHASILNEYGWVWLNRDGSPTLLTHKLYPKLLGEQDSTERRFALQASLLAGETEFWRAYRHYAGVLHFVYLTASDPNAFTSDHFVDVTTLRLEPHFAQAMAHAFNPLGVYLNFWQTLVGADESRFLTVAMVNDEDRPRAGALQVVFEDAAGKAASEVRLPFHIAGLGAQSYTVSLKSPGAPGRYVLKAVASPDDAPDHPTVSQRDLAVEGRP